MATISPATINDQIDALDASVLALDAEARELSLDAVSGVPEAAEKLAELRARIAQATADRVVLGDALTTSRRRAVIAADAANEGRRKEALASAQRHAGKLIEKAADIDKMIADLKQALEEIHVLELNARQDCMAARVRLDTATVGQRGIHVFALDTLSHFTSGNKFGAPRPLHDIASRAWSSLLSTETE